MNKIIEHFKNIDEKLRTIGFEKLEENEHIATYRRHNKIFGYTQRLDIVHKVTGRHLVQSYDEKTNCVCGLTGYEMRLALKKMKSMGLYNNMTANWSDEE